MATNSSQLYDTRIQQLLALLTRKDAQLTQAKQAHEAALADHATLTARLNAIETERNLQAQEASSLIQEARDIKKQQSQWASVREGLEQDLKQKDTRLARATSQLRDLRSEMDLQQTARNELERKISELGRGRSTAKINEAELTSALATEKSRSEMLEKELAEIKANLERAGRAKEEALSSTMRLKSENQQAQLKQKRQREEEQASAEQQLSKLRIQLAQTEQIASTAKEEAAHVQRELKQAIVDKIQNEVMISQLENREQINQQKHAQEVQQLNSKLDVAGESLKQLETEVEESQKQVQKQEQEKNELIVELERFRQREEQVWMAADPIIRENYERCQADLEEMSRRMADMDGEMANVVRESHAAALEASRAIASLKVAEMERARGMRRIRDLEEEVARARRERVTAEKTGEHFHHENALLKREVKDLRERLLDALTKGENNLRSKVEMLVDENAKLKRERESERGAQEKLKAGVESRVRGLENNYKKELEVMQTRLEAAEENHGEMLSAKLDRLVQSVREDKSKRGQVLDLLRSLPVLTAQLASKSESSDLSKLKTSQLENHRLREQVGKAEREAESKGEEARVAKKKQLEAELESKAAIERAEKTEANIRGVVVRRDLLQTELARFERELTVRNEQLISLRESLKAEQATVARKSMEAEHAGKRADTAEARFQEVNKLYNAAQNELAKRKQEIAYKERAKVGRGDGGGGGGEKGGDYAAEVTLARVREENLKSLVTGLRAKVEKQQAALKAVDGLVASLREQAAQKRAEEAAQKDPLDKLTEDLKLYSRGGASAAIIRDLREELEEREQELAGVKKVVAQQQEEFEELIAQHQAVLGELEEREIQEKLDGEADLQQIRIHLDRLESAGEQYESDRQRVLTQLGEQNAELVEQLRQKEERVEELEKLNAGVRGDLHACYFRIDGQEQNLKALKETAEALQAEKMRLEERLQELENQGWENKELRGQIAVHAAEVQAARDELKVAEKHRIEEKAYLEKRVEEAEKELQSAHNENQVLAEAMAAGSGGQQPQGPPVGQNERSIDLKRSALEVELRTTRRRLHETVEDLCAARGQILVLEEKKKLLELESGRHEVEVGRLADLEKESKVLRLENKRLFGETRSLEEQCLQKEQAKHEAVLKARNLENQNLLLQKQAESKQQGADKEAPTPVNVQIRKLLGVINRARRLNESHVLHSERVKSLLTVRPAPSSGLEAPEPSKRAKQA